MGAVYYFALAAGVSGFALVAYCLGYSAGAADAYIDGVADGIADPCAPASAPRGILFHYFEGDLDAAQLARVKDAIRLALL